MATSQPRGTWYVWPPAWMVTRCALQPLDGRVDLRAVLAADVDPEHVDAGLGVAVELEQADARGYDRGRGDESDQDQAAIHH